MGRRKVDAVSVIDEVKTDKNVSKDMVAPEEVKSVVVEDEKKLDKTSPVTEPVSEVKNEVVEENNNVDKVIFDGLEIHLNDDSILKAELHSEPTELSNFIFLLEDALNSNQSTEFDTVNLKNKIRALIAEFK